MDCIKIRNYANEMLRYAQNNDYRIVYPAVQYYETGIKNPSVAMLVLHEELNKKECELIVQAYDSYTLGNNFDMGTKIGDISIIRENMFKADSHPIVQKAKQAFEQKWDELYPLTKIIRCVLINYNAVSTTKVMPKARGLKKFLLAKQIKRCLNLIG